MTQKERDAILGIIDQTRGPSTPGTSYELENGVWVSKPEQQLVPGVPNHKLLDSEEYKAGYVRGWKEVEERLRLIFLSDVADERALRAYSRRGQKIREELKS